MTDELTPDDVAAALALGDDEIPNDLDNAPPLTIPDKRYANRVLRRVGMMRAEQVALAEDAQAELAALDDLIRPEKERIMAFLEDRHVGIQRALDWLLRGLEGWTRAVNAQDPKVVTTKVVAGEVRLRKNPDRFLVLNHELVAKIMPETMKPPEVQPSEVKAQLKPSEQPYVASEGDEAVEVLVGYELRAAVNGAGDVVPGVAFMVAKARRFEWSVE